MKNLLDFINIVGELRKKCPWDREQTIMTLSNNVIEEGYELMYEAERGEREKLKEEIGDLLLVVIMMLVILEEEGEDIEKVVDTALKKIIKRHPHVFDKEEIKTSDGVVRSWEKVKNKRWEDEGKELPALFRAYKINKRASRKGFDWNDINGVYEKIREEIEELENCDEEKKEEEFGDLLFVVSHIGNFLNINPEIALFKACDKFSKRFKKLEKLANTDDLKKFDTKTLDKMWKEIKSIEKK